tara:strand:+ start:17 stop:454 length:438 start_codon:yes stop_codon:yes gene_type:complete
MLIQRVDSAKVLIENKLHNQIHDGMLVFVGIHKNDTIDDVDYLLNKLIHLRIFNDTNNKMNLSIQDVKGEILIISQFTLLANTKRGLRPSFTNSKKPEEAKKMYNILLKKLNTTNIMVKSGKFAADMDIQLNNVGPATFILESNH